MQAQYDYTTSNDYDMDLDDHGPSSSGDIDTRPPALRYDTTTTDGIPEPDTEDSSKNHWDAFGNGRQRIFARPSRGEETGLEGLMEGWGLKEPQGQASRRGGWTAWFGS